MIFYAYVHDVGNLTKPVFVAEFKCSNEGEAYQKAIKNAGVKQICGKQQTGRLIVKIHTQKIDFSKL